MPRRPRVFVEGALYHVYNRFARGEGVFGDRKRRAISSNGFGKSRRAMDWSFSLGLCSQTTSPCGRLPCRFPERCSSSNADSAGISIGVGEGRARYGKAGTRRS